jgi:hypothetical protein
MVSLTADGVRRIRESHLPRNEFVRITGKAPNDKEMDWVMSGWIPGSLP